jgi:hypothetical protein
MIVATTARLFLGDKQKAMLSSSPFNALFILSRRSRS